MSSDLTIGEQVVLLALDEETGILREAPLRVSLAVAAAALLELSFSEHMQSHPERTPREWLLALREQALDTAYQGLSEEGLVRKQGRRVLGVFGSVTYQVTGLSELVVLRGRLAVVLVQGQEADERTAALITVLHHAGLQAVMPQVTEERLSGVAEGQGSVAALGDAIRTTVAALTARSVGLPSAVEASGVASEVGRLASLRPKWEGVGGCCGSDVIVGSSCRA
ncbi:GPP34 family phosphoprotein [Streptomyces sp. NPDC056039]|uniref:GOLPH3/VPS74 family protein n=1 Tax=Streptomyces sp. NPDC056039 TaxID=3345687 RepID=UPI0035E0FE1B